MKKIVFTLTIFTLLLASCQTDDWGGGGNNNNGNAASDSFLLRLNVPGSNINTRMTVPHEDGERDVNTLHVFFFEPTGAQNYVGHVVFGTDNIGVTDPNLLEPIDLSIPLHVRFNAPTAAGLNNNTHYRLLLVANVEHYIQGMNLDTWLNTRIRHRTLTEALNNQQMLVTNFGTTEPGHKAISSNNLLMSAMVDKPADVEEVHVPLIRAVVRIDVDFAAGLTSHTLESVSVWNVPQSTSLWDPTQNNFSTLMLNRPIQRIDNVVGNRVRGQLYTFENRQNSISQNDLHTTAVILGITENATGTTTFHRVNVTMPFAGQNLMRNTVHNVTVNRVLGPGSANEQAAYGAPVSQLQVTINNADMDSRGVILVDGDNVLVLPTNRIVFCPAGGERDFTIFTHSPDGSARLGVSGLVMDDGLTAILSGHSLVVSATPSIDARQGFIEIRFGNITTRIEVVQASSFVEYLELNLELNDISPFPTLLGDDGNGNFNVPVLMQTPDGLPNYVRVTSSHRWTARVFSNSFSFADANNPYAVIPDRMISGEPGEMFRLATILPNLDDRTHYGFVLVSLESNPNINQVLVLRQQGADNVRVFAASDPSFNDELVNPVAQFTAGGVNIPHGTIPMITNVFYVRHTDRANMAGQVLMHTWTAGAAHFQALLEDVDATTTRVTITSPGHNPYESVLNGRILLSSGMGGSAAIYMTKAVHILNLTHTPSTIPVAGGTTNDITVESSEAWEAEIIGVAPNPFSWNVTASDKSINWLGTPSLSQASGTNGQAFTVTFPGQPLMMIDQSPTITVRVRLTATPNIYRTITVTQGARTPRNINLRSWGGQSSGGTAGSQWGTWSPDTGPSLASHRNNFGRLRDEIINATAGGANNFGGATATMRTGTRTMVSALGLPNNDHHVFLANNFGGHAAAQTAIRTWLTTATPDVPNHRILILTSEYAGNASNATALLGVWGYSFGGSGSTTATGVYGNANSSAIHNFLFRDGPFRILDSDGNPTDFSGNVLMRPQDTAHNTAQSWSSTARTIMMHPGSTTRARITICSARRIIAIPEPEIMGLGGRTNTDWSNAANVAFTRNLAAWIVGVATYGRDFLHYVNWLASERDGTIPLEVLVP